MPTLLQGVTLLAFYVARFVIYCDFEGHAYHIVSDPCCDYRLAKYNIIAIIVDRISWSGASLVSGSVVVNQALWALMQLTEMTDEKCAQLLNQLLPLSQKPVCCWTIDCVSRRNSTRAPKLLKWLIVAIKQTWINLSRPEWRRAVCSANVTFIHLLLNCSFGDQSQKILDRSSPDFQGR